MLRLYMYLHSNCTTLTLHLTFKLKLHLTNPQHNCYNLLFFFFFCHSRLPPKETPFTLIHQQIFHFIYHHSSSESPSMSKASTAIKRLDLAAKSTPVNCSSNSLSCIRCPVLAICWASNDTVVQNLTMANISVYYLLIFSSNQNWDYAIKIILKK